MVANFVLKHKRRDTSRLYKCNDYYFGRKHCVRTECQFIQCLWVQFVR
jgi:hypothetical protein